MNKQAQITKRKQLTRSRVRSKISGSATRPRLSVKISNYHVTAQLIDDQASKTLVYVSSIGKDNLKKSTMSEKAQWVGSEIASQAVSHKISQAVFDRGERIYHGRVKILAEAARSKGLKF